MPHQMSFAGFEERPDRDRLIYLIYPPKDISNRIFQLAQIQFQKLDIRAEPVATERLHITLHHLGDYPSFPAEIRAQASRVGDAIRSKSFDVSFDKLMAFGKRDGFSIVLTSQSMELKVFHQVTGLEMWRGGLKRFVEPTITPHITLLYKGPSVREQPIESISWTVREFHLVHSLLGQTQHRILQTWNLQD